jgi:glycosyltransferase involved in cell wall biosynthesis
MGPNAVALEERPRKNSFDTTQAPHVLFVIDQLCRRGGAENALLRTIDLLPKDRFRVSLLTFQIDCRVFPRETFSCPLHVLPLRRTYGWTALKAALALNRLVQQEKVSIVHTFFETSDLWAAPIAKWSGCKVLISSRRDMGILRTRKHLLAYPVVNRLFDRVLAVSDGVRSYSLSHDGLSPEKVQTLYSGIDLKDISQKAARTNALPDLKLDPNQPIVTTLANIRPVKGIDIFIRAAAHVCREFPLAKFLVIGDVLVPATYAELKNLVDSLGLKKNVHFVGSLSNPYPLLAASSVFCLPSRSEGFSNALLEAMGSGLPCIATRVGGNAEAITSGFDGYIVESEDAEGMAERILELLLNPASAHSIGESARKTVEARFSICNAVRQLTAIYSELLVANHA